MKKNCVECKEIRYKAFRHILTRVANMIEQSSDVIQTDVAYMGQIVLSVTVAYDSLSLAVSHIS
jgi:hypothetical protein